MGIYVVGMHRSGTSVLSRCVGLLIGYEGYAGAGSDNQEGHWELPRMNRVLDEVLRRLDADWVSPPLAPVSLDDPRVIDLKPEVAGLVDALGPEPWVLKDPRLALTMAALLALPQAQPIVIATFRDPIEVAGSVAARDGYVFDYGLALWESYNRLLVEQARALDPRRTIWVSYQQVMTEPGRTVDRLADGLSGLGHVLAADGRERALAAINPNLKHQESPDEASAVRLSAEQRGLLEVLRAAAEGVGEGLESPPPLTHWAEALIETRRPYARLERDNRLLRRRLRPLKPVFRARDAVRRRLDLPVHPDPFGDDPPLNSGRRGPRT